MTNIASSVAWTTSVAALVSAYMYAFEQHDLPTWMPAIAPSPVSRCLEAHSLHEACVRQYRERLARAQTMKCSLR